MASMCSGVASAPGRAMLAEFLARRARELLMKKADGSGRVAVNEI